MANHYTRQIPGLSEAQRQELQRWVKRPKIHLRIRGLMASGARLSSVLRPDDIPVNLED